MSDLQPSAIRIVAFRRPFTIFNLRPWQPPLNLYETERALVLVVELAGIDPAHLHVDVHPTHVSIRGSRQPVLPAALRRLHRMEIAAGPFQIELPITTPIDPALAEARYANGMLEVQLPFAQEVMQRVVTIRIGEGGV